MEAVGQNKVECEALLERLTATDIHAGHSLSVDLKFTLIQVSVIAQQSYRSYVCELVWLI